MRLYQGVYSEETVYSDDPVGQACRFVDEGASWLHVVDLDAARSGKPMNLAAIAAIAAEVDVPVQAGGGVRSIQTATDLAEAGVARVVIGTAAVQAPELVDEVAAQQPVAVGLDARGRDVATHGWEQGGGGDLIHLAKLFESSGVEALVVTEISRDGTMCGPDIQGLATVLASSSLPVIASGGVASLEDLQVLVGLKALSADGVSRILAGVIVGRALYEGRFSVTQALDTLAATASEGPVLT